MLLTAPAHRALLVEDNPADAQHLRALLAESPDIFELTIADRLGAALELLTHERFAVVLIDLEASDADRAETLDALRAGIGSTPVVLYSGMIDGAVADKARRLGVHEVLRKGSLDGPGLAAALRTVVDAANFGQAVRDKLAVAAAAKTDVAVIRLVVEQPPGLVGPSVDTQAQIRRAVAERLSAHLDVDDGLFDLGDHRYGVVADVRGGSAGAVALTEKLEHAFDRPIRVENDRAYLLVGTGAGVATAGSGTAEELLERAAAALRASGVLPRAVQEPTAPSDLPPFAGASFSSRLRHAIQANELVLHYQPIVRVGDDRISVVEALVRWDDPQRGLLYPGDFIPQAEETSLIEEIGGWALLEACRQLKRWDEEGVAPVRCAVNLSARELCSASLPARVADALAATGLPPDRLEVELTESMFADPDGAARMIGRLRALGVRVAIDDFGTGYSSLAYLTRFAVDVVKVDGEFVRRAAEDPDAAAVVKAIVGIAHQLDLEVVAEGVETVEQLAFIRKQGCDLVQGWLFCEAMPGMAAAEWLNWARQRAEDRDAEEGEPVAPPAAGQMPAVRLPPAALAAIADEPRPSGYVGGIVGARSRTGREALVDRAVIATTILAGGVLGYIVAFPAETPADSSCPAPGEGQAMCLFQKGWLPAIVMFLTCVLAVVIITDVVRKLPGRMRTRRVQREYDQRRRAEASARRARLASARRASGGTSGGTVAPLLLAEAYEAAQRRTAA